MVKTILSLATAVAIMPLFWASVVPNGAEICSSSIEFATPLDTPQQKEAAKYAKAKFCHVVQSYPQ